VAGVDPDAFHAALNRRGTFVGPGHWFGWSDRYFRLGFGWPNDADLAPALATLDDAAAEAAG
jgi:DNA-binding transcriptional MocR family regulator